MRKYFNQNLIKIKRKETRIQDQLYYKYNKIKHQTN